MDIPTKIWAKILASYCSFEDVRSCLAVNRTFRDKIPPLLDHLFIFKASELHPGYAARFTNIRRVFIYSLVSLTDFKDNVDEYDKQHLLETGVLPTTLCAQTARRVVPFLEAVNPNNTLTFVHIGGYAAADNPISPYAIRKGLFPNSPGDDRKSPFRMDLRYQCVNCQSEGHQEAFRTMLSDFCNAFARGSLDLNELGFSGLFDATYTQLHDDILAGDRTDCQLCRRICETFPLHMVMHTIRSRHICVSDRERYRMIHQRDENFLREAKLLLNLLCGEVYGSSAKVNLPAVRHGKNWECAEPSYVLPIQIGRKTLELFEFLINSNMCDPADVEEAELKEWSEKRRSNDFSISQETAAFDGKRSYISRMEFDRLSGLGFRLSESDFVIIVPGPGGDWRLDPSSERLYKSIFNCT